MGNLLGDFIKGADLKKQPERVILGLQNHQSVDRFTDQHQVLRPLKQILSKERRRFSGIISDVAFDYFLSKHWERFSEQDIDVFVEHCYREILSVQHLMHDSMRRAMVFMVEDDGLRINREMSGVGKTLDRLSRRIRFENKLYGAIDEVEANYAAYEEAFLILFPDLKACIEQSPIEQAVSYKVRLILQNFSNASAVLKKRFRTDIQALRGFIISG